jgi:hypothetical protein
MGMAGSMLAEQDFVNTVQPTSDEELQDADRFISGEAFLAQRANPNMH